MKQTITGRLFAAFGHASLLVMVTVAPAAAEPASSPAGASQLASNALRQSFELRVPVPPAPIAVAGDRLLVYELHLTNFAREPLVLDQVDVADRDGGTLARLRGDDLTSRLGLPDAGDDGEGTRTIRPGTQALLYLELSLGDAAAPTSLSHRIRYRAASVEDVAVSTVEGGEVAVSTESPPVLSPPLRGGPWVAAYDYSWERGHRRVPYAVAGRARIPGRFAIDWLKLDASGRKARGNEDDIANWHGQGADVLAVADGVVAATRDDVAESPTISGHPDHPLEDSTGNYVALAIGTGRYVFYEHLEPGSIRVEPGQRVRRGQTIAAVGFTGHSVGPHLHFHVADANSPLNAEGMPFALERFEVLGRYEGFDALAGIPWTPLDGGQQSVRVDELPAPNAVVEFSPD